MAAYGVAIRAGVGTIPLAATAAVIGENGMAFGQRAAVEPLLVGGVAALFGGLTAAWLLRRPAARPGNGQRSEVQASTTSSGPQTTVA